MKSDDAHRIVELESKIREYDEMIMNMFDFGNRKQNRKLVKESKSKKDFRIKLERTRNDHLVYLDLEQEDVYAILEARMLKLDYMKEELNKLLMDAEKRQSN